MLVYIKTVGLVVQADETPEELDQMLRRTSNWVTLTVRRQLNEEGATAMDALRVRPEHIVAYG